MGAKRHKKIAGGQGGRRGHSNMDHWVSTEEIKTATRILRRRADKNQAAEQLDEEKDQRKAS
jgi:hypothetical protein